MFKEEPWK